MDFKQLFHLIADIATMIFAVIIFGTLIARISIESYIELRDLWRKQK